MKSFSSILLIAALGIIPAQAAELWANGVTVTEGWIDYEKQKPKNDGDDNLCWAASASNIIDFWQQNYVVPTNTPTGSAIWERFKEASQYDVGGNFPNALQWWIGGDYEGSTWTLSSDAADNNRACYRAPSTTLIYPDNSTKTVYPISTDINSFGGYYWDILPENWVNNEQYSNTNAKQSHLKNLIWTTNDKTQIDLQMIMQVENEGLPISLSLTSEGGSITLGHAVTLWGLDYESGENEDFTIKHLWITDSDDYTTNLQKITVSYVDEKIYLDDYTNNTDYGKVYLRSASGIKISESNTWGMSPVPEPSTATLSLLALAALVYRRRRC